MRDRIVATQPFVQNDIFFVPYTTSLSLNWPYEPRDCLLPASKLPSSAASLAASSPAATHAGSPAAGSTPGTVYSSAPKEHQETWVMNPAFESHLRDLRNWSLGPEFKAAFPGLADTARIKEGR